MYASGQEILEHYRHRAQEYSVHEHTKFRHRIIGAEWDDTEAVWEILVEDLATGDKFVHVAEVFINCGGILK